MVQGLFTCEATLFIAMTWHSLCCTDVLFSISVYVPEQLVALLEQGGWTGQPPELPANLTQAVILWCTNNAWRHTLCIQTQILLVCLEGRLAIFLVLFFSNSSQVPVKDPFVCFHPKRSACSSMHPGVLVPLYTAWLDWKSKAHYILFLILHTNTPDKKYWICANLSFFLNSFRSFRALNKAIVEDNFRNFNNIHCSLAKLCIEVIVCVCPAQL